MKFNQFLRLCLVYSVSCIVLNLTDLRPVQAANPFFEAYAAAFPGIHLANQQLELAQKHWKELIRAARRAGLTVEQSPDWKFALIQLEKLEEKYQIHYMDPLVNLYAWGIPSDEAIEIISQYSPLVEIGAGKGYWARLLSEKGADIVAYDNDILPPEQLLFPVNYGTEEAVTKNLGRTLFLCWPPQMDTNGVAFNALIRYQGKYVIYVGELPRIAANPLPVGHPEYTGDPDYELLTGDPDFFDLLNEQFILKEHFPLPNWPGYFDQLYIFERKEVLVSEPDSESDSELSPMMDAECLAQGLSPDQGLVGVGQTAIDSDLDELSEAIYSDSDHPFGSKCSENAFAPVKIWSPAAKTFSEARYVPFRGLVESKPVSSSLRRSNSF